MQNNINQKQNGGITKVDPATTFYDQATAEKALRDALQTEAGQKLIKNVTNASKNKDFTRFEKTIDIGGDLGKGFQSVDETVSFIEEKLSKVQLILEPDGKGGFSVISSYPTK